MKGRRFRSVVILGGAGFVGANLAHHLLAETDAKVHVFDNLSRRGTRHNLESLQKAAGDSGRLQITIGDIRDSAMVERCVRYATEIYHFAAQVAVTTSMEDPRLDFDVNLAGTFNLLEAIRKAGTRPFLLFTSTNKVYGELPGVALNVKATRYELAGSRGISEAQPLDFHSPYGCSKGAADQYVRDYARMYGIPTVVLRMSCIAGPRQFGNEDQGWVAHFLYSALQQQPLVIYGDGRQVRDVLCVHDLVKAFEAVHANLSVTEGQVYNIGGGEANSTSLLELISMIEELTGKKVRYHHEQRRPGDQLVYITDNGKLRRDTGWEPRYGLSQTVQAMQEWYKRNRELFAAAARPSALPQASLRELPRTA